MVQAKAKAKATKVCPRGVLKVEASPRGPHPWQLGTELLWAGTKRNLSLLGCHVLQLGSDISNHVRILGVTISVDLSLDQHVSKVYDAGFYRLRQLRRITKSLDKESTATLCCMPS